jgi:hypothetical protein
MDATQRQGSSIGITYAVRHLKSIFIALGGAYGSSWGPEAGGETTPQKCTLPLEDSLVIGNKHEERREGIEKMLKSNDMYTRFSAEIQISGTALGYIYRTDNLIETLVNPAKDGQGDWKPTRSLISKFFDDMEFDLKQNNRILQVFETQEHQTMPLCWTYKSIWVTMFFSLSLAPYGTP